MSDDQRSVRLGDVVDDYCPRCRLLMNHGVVGMVGVEIRKVRCNTCISEHVYRHGKLPARRRKATDKLFQEVLKGITPDAAPGAAPGPPQDAPEESPQGETAAQRPEAESATDGSRATETEEPPPPPSAHPQRRLYTIRRAISDRESAKNQKKP